MPRFKGKKSSRKKKNPNVDFDRNSTEIPALVADCLAYLEKNALNLQGLFRVSGSFEEINKLNQLYLSRKKVDLGRCKDPHIVSGLLKLYFRDMNDALLTWELYECFLAAIGVRDHGHRMECLRKVLQLLPPGNQSLLGALMRLLSKVAQKEATNLMSPSNLAIVFAPTLYRPKEETFDIVMGDAQHANLLIETFITHYSELFERGKGEAIEIVLNQPHIQEFNKSMKKGTRRLAQSFIEEEKAENLEEVKESIADQFPKGMTKERGGLEGVFEKAQVHPPPPVDRSTKYKRPEYEATIDNEIFEGFEPLSIDQLVKLLLDANTAPVEEYLDTLEVEERARVVEEMNAALKMIDL